MFLKKSLVLIGTTNENEKAVLSLDANKDLYEGRLRLYNFSNEPDGILSLGFYCGGKVSKAGLNRVSSGLYNFKIDKKEIDDNFSCAVINLFQGKSTPILFGNTNNVSTNIEKLSEIIKATWNSV